MTRCIQGQELEALLRATFPKVEPKSGLDKPTVWGVPRGGWCIAQMLVQLELAYQVYGSEPDPFADVIVDDIIHTGRTRSKWLEKYPNKMFYAPFENETEWLVFPWEKGKEEDAEELVTRILEHVGEDPNREGLLDTPNRVVRSWKELFSGYGREPKEILSKIFDTTVDQMVICKDIEFYSTCEHHLIPFFGKAHIGYLPKGKVVGLSKLARLVDVYARRLQLQENLTQQIADAIHEHIPDCRGAGVVVEAQHLCMCSRGVAKQNSVMKTSALAGVFRDQATRDEFFNLIK
jgi:GTP cyclohydrolase I